MQICRFLSIKIFFPSIQRKHIKFDKPDRVDLKIAQVPSDFYQSNVI